MEAELTIAVDEDNGKKLPCFVRLGVDRGHPSSSVHGHRNWRPVTLSFIHRNPRGAGNLDILFLGIFGFLRFIKWWKFNHRVLKLKNFRKKKKLLLIKVCQRNRYVRIFIRHQITLLGKGFYIIDMSSIPQVGHSKDTKK